MESASDEDLVVNRIYSNFIARVERNVVEELRMEISRCTIQQIRTNKEDLLDQLDEETSKKVEKMIDEYQCKVIRNAKPSQTNWCICS